jgi:hypothetical protein
METKNENKKNKNLDEESFILKITEILDSRVNTYIKNSKDAKRSLTNILLLVLTIFMTGISWSLINGASELEEANYNNEKNKSITAIVANTVKELDIIYDRINRKSLYEAEELIKELEDYLSTNYNEIKENGDDNPVIRKLLISVIGLHGMTSYRICQKDSTFDIDEVIHAGKSLLKLSESSGIPHWHGYRLLGMGLWRKNSGIIESKILFDSVVYCLKESLLLNPAKRVSMDHMNLFELYFVNSRFPEAKLKAIEIKDKIGINKLTDEQVAIDSFKAMMDITLYIVDDNKNIIKSIPNDSIKVQVKKQDTRWGTNFLRRFYNTIYLNSSIPDDKKDNCYLRLKKFFENSNEFANYERTN